MNFPVCFRRFLFLLFLAGSLSPSVADAAQTRRRVRSPILSRRIEAILRRPQVRRGFWGIVVAQLPGGKVLYERDADHLFQPASNMKLFTTAAALEKLGPDFVFSTTVESGGQPDGQGRVGDIFLVGRGDPNISSRELPYRYKSPNTLPADAVLKDLADKVWARGVREVTGDVVGDDRYFLYEPFSHDWSTEDLTWGYGAPITALAFNDNALKFHVLPGEKDAAPAKVWLDPVGDYYHIDNRLVTSEAGTKKQIFVERLPGSMALDVWGEIPVGAPEDDDTVAIADPPRLAAEIFKRALEARGVKVQGGIKTLELTRVEAAGRADPFRSEQTRAILAEHRSLPLSNDITVINKISQNLHAEMLLRTLARESAHYGSLSVGLEMLREFAGEIGIESDEIHFADGSGLSREALLTPSAILKLLVYMAKSPHADAFFSSLPIAGVDGTLGDRFVGTRQAGQIHAKTGTIEHVNTLSGYMILPSGKRLAFSILADNQNLQGDDAENVLDEVAQTIYDAFGGRSRRVPSRHRRK
ncbi:MAG TPA: D-alanyl-D-alanine carboxypeptidase/D-alanyl-D-alanine-endopeptidase [Terriglobia bacterium]|nr:D-alanyl-D-alanine carboxypeptidase/D-alanyl-D-alanine-endopeptidase [Terriglobia bacterium]